MEPLRKIFGKSLVLKQTVDIGTVLTREMLAAKKPGQGIPVADINQVVGRKTIKAISAGDVLCWKDLEE